MMEKLYFAKLRDDAIIPHKRDEDAGYDLYACVDSAWTIAPGETIKIPTGIASAFPSDYVAVIKDRSSLGGKGLHVAGGVIDSGYRGEWAIQLTNTTKDTLFVLCKEYINAEDFDAIYLANSKGDYTIGRVYLTKALAQVLFLPVPCMEVSEITFEELESFESERGANGFGSTDYSLNENYGAAACGLMPATE